MGGALLTTVIEFSRTHRELAYGLILFVAFAEALPIFGAFIPGDAIILGVSALVPTGALGLWPLMFAITVGAILGDGLSFWIGGHYRQSIVNHWPFSRHPRMVQRGEEFLRRHGGKSVFVARFTPGVRAIVPTLAGTLRMRPRRFYFMNVFSALCWGPVHILAGVAIGATLVVLGAVAGRLAVLVVTLAVLLGLVVWSTRYALKRLPTLVAVGQERARAWAQGREDWLGRAFLSILDPARRELPGLALLGAILVGSLWLFLGVLQSVLTGAPLIRANQAVLHFLQSLRTQWFDRVMVAVSEFGDAQVVIAVGIAVLLWFALRRNWRGAAHAAGVVGLSVALTLLVAPAPHALPLQTRASRWAAFAFPGGHSAANAALYGFIAMVAAWELATRWKLLVASITAILIVAVAFARIYLGANWLSGVLAGIAFGMAWAAFLAIAYLRRNPARINAAGLCAFTGTTLLLFGTVHVERSHGADLRRYALQARIRPMSMAQWWDGGWAQLAARRLNLLGAERAPLTFQWAGSLRALRQDLAAHGWRSPVAWTLRTTLVWLDPHARLSALPVLPHLQNGRPQALVRVAPLPGGGTPSRLVLRLWKSTVRLTGPGGAVEPLFVGVVQEQRLAHVNVLLTLTRTRTVASYDRGLRALAASIPASQLVRRRVEARTAGWNGRVLLGFDVGVRSVPRAKSRPARLQSQKDARIVGGYDVSRNGVSGD